MEDKSDNKSRREKRAEEDRKAKDRARRASGSRDRDRNRGDRDRNRDRDREAKSRARRSGSSAVMPGAVAERKRDDDRVSRKTSSSRRDSSSRTRSGSSRTRDSPRTPRSDRDEKSKERSRRKSSGQAVPGAVAENDNLMSPRERARRRKEGKQDDSPMTPMSARERARRRKERQQGFGSSRSVGSSSRSGGSSRRERSRRRREKEKQASMNAVPAPPLHSNQNKDGAEEVPTASAIDVETMEIEATTVPNITEDQLEAARQQGREEARNEQDKRRESQQGDDDGTTVDEAGPTQKGRRYAIAAFVFVVITAGIVVWLVTGKSDPTQEQVVGATFLKPPTEDDCVAVSKGLTVPRQSEASVRTYTVEMNVAVTSDMDLAALKSELAILSQRNVLPLLIGCTVEDGPIVIPNNNFVITNANVESVTMDSPKSCSLGTQSLCSLTYMEMDLFLKDPEVSSDYILDLITFVFENKGLLEVLQLLTPVEMIDTQRGYEVLATAEPAPTGLLSSSPSSTITQPPVDPVQDENCLNIAEGKAVDGREDLVLQEYDVYMDVMLGVSMNDLTTVTSELEEKLQRFLMPALVGCDPSLVVDSNENRRLATEDYVEDAGVKAEYLAGATCLPESDSPCYHYAIHLDIFVRKFFESADFTAPLMTKFREAPLVPRVGLQTPFVRITVVDTVAQTPSAMPSFSSTKNPTSQAPSQTTTGLPSTSPSSVVPPTNSSPQPTPKIAEQTPEPTSAPSAFPTRPPEPGVTPLPTQSPTKSPTKSPTRRPTKRPTRSPTKFPTPSPTKSTPNPTKATPSPTMATPNPTAAPSPSPTVATPSPTGSPTRTCILSNDDLKTARDNWFSNQPVVEAQYGSIGDWCFGPGVTSMYLLFYERSNFNEDISNWDVSGITNMENMFAYAESFNQNIGNWNVSKVTSMAGMFYDAKAFNQNIGDWDVHEVLDMYVMFSLAAKFNQDLSNWDLSSLKLMDGMFYGASDFNKNLCDWKAYSSTFSSVERVFRSTACPSPYGDPPSSFCYDCPT